MGWLRRWGAPLVLGLGALASGATAVAVEASVAGEGEDIGGPRLGTPVISARRLPTVVAEPIAERRLHGDLEAWLAVQPPDTCLAVEGDDGDVRFDHRSDVSLVPASTAKLLTATAAIRELGEDHRFRTVLSATATPAGEVVPGDLVLIGGGDPLLASPDYAARFRRQPQTFTDLDSLAAQVVEAGIRRVDGAVVGDEGRYDRERYVASWPRRYVDQDQIGPLSALSVNDGFAEYPLAPDAPGDLVAAEDPAVDAAAVLTRLLEARGVDVAGPPRSGPSPEGATELAAVESVPVREVVAQMLRESDNSTAELLLKELGHAAGDPSTEGGRRVTTAALGGAAIDAGGVVVADGSGLSLDNRLTCGLLVELLTASPEAAILDDGLPVAGQTGTLAERFDGTELDGVLRAKTGTLNSVTALAGVVEDDDAPLTFALVVNLPGSVVSLELIGAQEELAEILRSWPRVPDVSVLGPEPAAET